MCKRLSLVLLGLFFTSLFVSAQTSANRKRVYEVEYKWEHNSMKYTVSLHINKRLYNYYRDQREHSVYRYRFGGNVVQPNYFSFMLSERDRQVIQPLAKELKSYAKNELDGINLALTFVQNLPYAYDSDTKGVDEYVRYPIETLVDGCGDCEDKVALLVALLYEMKADVVLMEMPEHIAVGVCCDALEGGRYLTHEGKRYYYMETTVPKWKIGQIPDEYLSGATNIIPIDASPHLLCKDLHINTPQSYGYERATCRLNFNLVNQGPGRATGVWIRVRIIDVNNKNAVLSEEQFFLDDVEEGEDRPEELSFRGLINGKSSIEIEIGGKKVDKQTYTLDFNYRTVK